MTQISLQWDGTTIGDAVLAAYGEDEVAVWKQAAETYDRTLQGVLRRDDSIVLDGVTYDLSGLLEVTNPSSYTVRVASGGAQVDGLPFFTSANVDFTTTDDGTAITAPGSGTNYYRVVVRKSWSAQTIRLAVLNVNTSAPVAVTQTQGTTWEISLATVAITSAGAVTVTDTRVWCGPYVSTNNIVNDAVDDTKAGNRVARFVRRQGGDTTHWRVAGSTTYTPTGVLMQGGTVLVTIADGSATGSVDVTFPIAFSGAPLVFLTIAGAASSYPPDSVRAVDTSGSVAEQIRVTVDRDGTSGADDVTVQWLAIGPE